MLYISTEQANGQSEEQTWHFKHRKKTHDRLVRQSSAGCEPPCQVTSS